MPIQTRTGQNATEAPRNKYRSPISVFIEEMKNERKNEPKKKVIEEAKEKWKTLDPKVQQKYNDIYDKEEAKFQEQLLLFYGADKKDLKQYTNLKNIPEKPKKPVGPSLAFIHEHMNSVKEGNDKLSNGQAMRLCSDMYSELSKKERQRYEDEYERKFKEYEKELKAWQNKYQDKADQLDEIIEKKLKKSKGKDDFHYKELSPKRRKPRKIASDQPSRKK